MSDKLEQGSGSWAEWARYILKTIEDLKKGTSDNNELLQKLRTEIRIIQTKMAMKAALAGFVAALIPSIISLIYFIHKLKEHGIVP